MKVVNVVGNYDSLTSHGFRGFPVSRLVVWGDSMFQDAVGFQGLLSGNVTKIGSLRYSHLGARRGQQREAALAAAGLKPHIPTIFFAGFLVEYHYFEILEVLDELRASGVDCQMVIRVYPNRVLARSPMMRALECEARRRNVYVSWADVHRGATGQDVLQIEEDELWSLLAASDVVVNFFSTISLEACIFDKPAINMWYFPPPGKAMAGSQEFIDYSRNYHNRRMESYGAIPRVGTREDLIREIRRALQNPEERRENRRRVVEKECGVLDGLAGERLVGVCLREFGW